MKLTVNLEKQVETAATKDEARETIRNTGMILDDAELNQVAGGEGAKNDPPYGTCAGPDSFNGGATNWNTNALH